MATVDFKEMQAAARWIRAHDARDTKETVEILGITRARLSQMLSDGDISGKMFGGRYWIPKREIDKHIVEPGERRIGRPRGGAVR